VRRTAKAAVKLWTDGTGKVLVNSMLFIDYFPRLQDRYLFSFSVWTVTV